MAIACLFNIIIPCHLFPVFVWVRKHSQRTGWSRMWSLLQEASTPFLNRDVPPAHNTLNPLVPSVCGNVLPASLLGTPQTASLATIHTLAELLTHWLVFASSKSILQRPLALGVAAHCRQLTRRERDYSEPRDVNIHAYKHHTHRTREISSLHIAILPKSKTFCNWRRPSRSKRLTLWKYCYV